MSKYTQKQGESILYFIGVYSLIVITEQNTEFAAVYLTDCFSKSILRANISIQCFWTTFYG